MSKMHEVVIANRLLVEAGKHGRIKKLSIEVGELAPIVPEELKACLEKLSGCKVEVEERKAIVKCSCGYQGRPKIVDREHDAVIFECPKCKKIPKIVEGDEIILKEVEV